MIEDLLDSDVPLNISTSQIDCSGDMQILAEARGDQLQEDNATLVKEMNVLKAQFEQAVAVSEGTEKLHKENEMLKATIREMSSEKEELLNRLDICVRSQQESAKLLEDEKANNTIQRQNDIAAMQKEIGKTKKSLLAQIDSLCAEVEALQKQKKQDEIVQKTLECRLQKLTTNLSHYCNKDFSSIEDVFLYFEQNLSSHPIQTIPQYQLITERSNTCSSNNNNKKLKKTKKQLHAALEKLQEMESNCTRAQRELTEVNSRHRYEVSQIEAKLNQTVDELQHQITLERQRNTSLESKVETLKKELTKVKETKVQNIIVSSPHPSSVPQAPIVQQQTAPQIKHKNSKSCHDSEALIEELNSRIEELNNQLASLSKKRDDAVEESKKLAKRFNEFQLENEKDKSELSALKKVHSETVHEVETLRAALHARPPPSKEGKSDNIRRREIQKMKVANQQLEKIVETLKKQNFDTQIDKERLQRQLQESSRESARCLAEADEAKNQLSRLQADYNDLNRRFQAKPDVSDDDILPRCCWNCSEFDTTLTAAIDRIVINPSLRASSKLQQVFKIIAKHYRKQLEQRAATIDEAYSESRAIQDALEKFIVSLSINLLDSPTTVEEFVRSDDMRQILLSRVNDLKTSCNDACRSRDSLQHIVNAFTANFGGNSDVLSRINYVRTQIESQQVLLQKKAKKIKSLKSAINEANHHIDEATFGVQSQIEELNAKVNSLSSENSRLVELNRSLKSESSSMRDKLHKAELQIDSLRSQTTDMDNRYKQQAESYVSKVQSECREELEKMQAEIDDAHQQVADTEAVIIKYKKVLQTQKETIKDRDAELDAIKANYAADRKSILERSKIEKQQITDSYEAAIAELTSQCEKHRSDVVRLSSTIAAHEKTAKEAKALAISLKRENARLEKVNQTERDQFSREKKLAETAAKDAVMQAESEYTTKLNEMRARWEAEKRRILAVVVDGFRQFFNPAESIDERAFNSVLQRAQDELARLAKTDAAIRRMVGATGRQATDDAVAQFVMGQQC